MIYLDYSATTLIDQRVLDVFISAIQRYIGNSNSDHEAGKTARQAINDATNDISSLLKLDSDKEIVITSGASEANNLVIKGINHKKWPSKTIITTPFEHPSIIAPLNQLAREGIKIIFVKLTQRGTVDFDDLKRLLKDKPSLVTIESVNSELGIIQPLKEVAILIKEISPTTLFHSDVTQSIGKHIIDLNILDFASCSAHKFYGLNGIGMLIKNKLTVLEPLISGGRSLTIHRSGTPPTALILSLAEAVKFAVTNLDKKYNYVNELNKYARLHLIKIDGLLINSFNEALPHILNISLVKHKSRDIVSSLSKQNIFVSAHTACQSDKTYSEAIFALTGVKKTAQSSIRISLSHLTTQDEIEALIGAIKHL